MRNERIADKPIEIADKPTKIADKRSKIADKPRKIADKPSKIADKSDIAIFYSFEIKSAINIKRSGASEPMKSNG